MCFACDMEAMWFAVMEARANAAAEGESASAQPGEPAIVLAPGQQEEAAFLLPPPERGRVGEGVAGGTDETRPHVGRVRGPPPQPSP